jgi:hypothetical protein
VIRYYINRPITTMNSSQQVSSEDSISMSGTYADAFMNDTPTEMDGYTTPPRGVRNTVPSQKVLYRMAKKKSGNARRRLIFEQQMMNQMDIEHRQLMNHQLLERQQLLVRQQMMERHLTILRRHPE